MECVQRRVAISGQVQGVYFRQAARQRAEALGLVGWVRNRFDGRVEALLQGSPEAVEEMLRWCHEGPSEARVRVVDVLEEPIDTALESFTIERSG